MQPSSVLVLVCDKNYLDHAKSLFFAARGVGCWKDDLCLIANNIEDNKLDDFKKFGIEIIHVNTENYFYSKYYIFDSYMKKWKYLIYMDCDFTIFGNLNNIVENDIKQKSVLSVDREPFLIHQYFCQGLDDKDKNEVLKNLNNDYNLNTYGFNAGFMAFNTSLIQEDTLQNILQLSDSLQKINNHTSSNGSDQPILNLYFMKNINYIKDKRVCFWKGANTNTIAQHHCRWDAPWCNSNFSDRLNKTYLQNYRDNLNKFYENSTNKI